MIAAGTLPEGPMKPGRSEKRESKKEYIQHLLQKTFAESCLKIALRSKDQIILMKIKDGKEKVVEGLMQTSTSEVYTTANRRRFDPR